MDVFSAHDQIRKAAAWLSSSEALRFRLRGQLHDPLDGSPPVPPSFDFVELVLEWEEDPAC